MKKVDMRGKKLVLWIASAAGLLVVLMAASNTVAPELAAQNTGDTEDSGGDEEYGGREVEYHGDVQSFGNTEIALANGETFVLDQNTTIETQLNVGKAVEIEAIESNGGLLAVEIEADDFN